MRSVCVLIVFAPLVVPFVATAQPASLPASLAEPCSIPDDERWTDQEKFVWERVCIGETADFNAAPGYGGELDPEKPEGWPQNRVLRPAFLRMILLREPYRSALPPSGVVIIGARFVELIDLDGAELQSTLVLGQSILEEGANLQHLRSKYPISLTGSNASVLDAYGLHIESDLIMREGKFVEVHLAGARVGAVDLAGLKVIGWLNMSGLRVDGPLSAGKAELAMVDLVGAHIGSELSLEGSRVTGFLNMNALRVDSVLLMRDKAEFAEVNLVGARVRYVDLDSSKVTGLLDMGGLRVDENLAMSGKAEFGKVNLVGAHIGGVLSLDGSKVLGLLEMNRLQVGRDLFMRNEAEFAEVTLVGAHVGDVDLDNSKVIGLLNMNGLRVDRVLSADKAELAKVDLVGARVTNIDLVSSKVTGLLNMNGLVVDRQLSADQAELAEVNLVGAHIGGALSLEGSKVTGLLEMNGLRVDGGLFMRDGAEFAKVDLSGAHVGDVYLAGSTVGGNFDCFALEVEQHISMRNAKFNGKIDCAFAKIRGNLYLSDQFLENVNLSGTNIGALGLASAQWSDGVALDLRNANVGAIPDLENGWPPKLHVDGLTYRSVGQAGKFENWFNKIDRYAPQPYDQLASVVQSHGDGTLATSIRYCGRERERTEATRAAERAWLTILKYVIGYGYYPHLAIYWAIGLVVVGAIVLRVSGEGLAHQMPFGVTYSFDMLLPIIHLRESDYKFDLQGWARYYFYGHKIMGWVLAFFLAAAISGITK